MLDKNTQIAVNNENRSYEIVTLFNLAMDTIKKYMQHNGLNCSINIKFDGFIDELYNPVTLVYKKSLQQFCIYYSLHYMHNDNNKILNTFIRYIITTNSDGTFKTITDTKKEMKKLPFDTHYDVSYRNNYLVSDENITTGVICDSCLRVYKCDPSSDLFQHAYAYKCPCTPNGGKLSLIIDGKKQIDEDKKKFYNNLSLEDINRSKKTRELQQQALKNIPKKEDFDPEIFSEEGLNIIIDIIKQSPKQINRKPINDLIDKYIDTQPKYLAMANEAFPKQYYNAYKYAGINNQKKILANPILYPSYEQWDLEKEQNRIDNKTKHRDNQKMSPDKIKETVDSLDIQESTKKKLLATLENKGKKISRMKVAEYMEEAINIKDAEFLNILNNNFPDIYLESIKHMHKTQRYYLYELYPPVSEKFTEEFKNKYPGKLCESNQVDLQIERDPNADPLTKLNTFMMIHKRIGNKELIHEINDAVFHHDKEYLNVLKTAFQDKFIKVRVMLNNNILNYLDEIDL